MFGANQTIGSDEPRFVLSRCLAAPKVCLRRDSILGGADMKTILLTQNKFTLVDDDVYDSLSRFKWYARRSPFALKDFWYAIRRVPRKNGGGFLRMHRVITEAKPGKFVDHINHNGLDNRRENLRICSHKENTQNQLVHRDNATGKKGVGVSHGKTKFRARIRIDGALVHLGYFRSLEEAARAYDDAAKKHFGEFAQLNFPENK